MSARTVPLPSFLILSVMIAAAAFLAGRLSRAAPSADRRTMSAPAAPATVAPQPEISKVDSSLAKETPGEGSVREFSVRAARAPRSLATDDERQKVIEQWAEQDPLGAIQFARTKLKGDRQAQALSAVLAIWGKNDPAAAWAWVGATMPTATHHFDTLLEAFGKTSAATAAQYVNEFVRQHPAAALEVNLAALLGITYSGDFAAARAFVDANASLTPEVRGNLHNFIAGQWARYEPEAAAAWAMSLPAGPQRDQALLGLGESWAGVDPVAAAKFATALPAGEARQLALRQAIVNWLETDAEQARKWVLDTGQHEDYDQAVAAVATQNNFMFREPERALLWAGTIFDDTVRMQSTRAILFGLYERDPASTVAYIRNSPNFTEAQRVQLLAQFPPKN